MICHSRRNTSWALQRLCYLRVQHKTTACVINDGVRKLSSFSFSKFFAQPRQQTVDDGHNCDFQPVMMYFASARFVFCRPREENQRLAVTLEREILDLWLSHLRRGGRLRVCLSERECAQAQQREQQINVSHRVSFALKLQRSQINLVNVAQPVAGIAQPAHQLPIIEPPLQGFIREPAIAREEKVFPIGRDLRRKIPRGG